MILLGLFLGIIVYVKKIPSKAKWRDGAGWPQLSRLGCFLKIVQHTYVYVSGCF
jgi:hypothetical protein